MTPSLSDHFYIKFNLVFEADIVEICNSINNNYRKTNWNVFCKVILNELDYLFPLPTKDTEEITKAVHALIALLQKASNESTPVSRSSPKNYSLLLTSELSDLRKGYRRLLWIIKSCNSFKSELNSTNTKKIYKLGILNAKKSDRNKFCVDKPNLDP